MQETGWEHHVVSSKPELRVILSIEHQGVSDTNESEAIKHEYGDGDPQPQASVVERTLLYTNKSREDRAHDAESVVNHDPVVVDNSEKSVEGVLSVHSFSDLEPLEDAANESTTSGKSLINNIFESSAISKNPLLHSLCHL